MNYLTVKIDLVVFESNLIQRMLDNPTPNKLTFHNPTGFNG